LCNLDLLVQRFAAPQRCSRHFCAFHVTPDPATAITAIDQQIEVLIEDMDERIEAGQTTFRALIMLLCSIPGVGTLAAVVILSEIGRDMSRFPTAGHLLAWAGLCPGQNESAGKRKSSPRAKAPAGSRPCSSNAPGQPAEDRTATTRLSLAAS
jgi:hypothetical protein